MAKSPSEKIKQHLHTLCCLLLGLCLSISATAQDNMMAEGNKSVTLSYGLVNYYKTGMNRTLKNADNNFYTNSLGDYSYKSIVTNPFTFSFDYAYRDNQAFGLALSYFSYAMTEDRKDKIEETSLTLRGFYMSVSGRATRYISHKPHFMLYLFAGGGLKIRSQSSSAETDHEKEISYLHQTPLTSTAGFAPLFWEGGIGLKFAITRKIGLMTELSRTPGWMHIGLCYLMLPKSRKKSDRIGW